MAFDFESGRFSPISTSFLSGRDGLKLNEIKRESGDIWFVLVDAYELPLDPTDEASSPSFLVRKEVRLKADYNAVIDSVNDIARIYDLCGVDTTSRTFHVADAINAADIRYDEDSVIETYNVYPMDLFLTWNDQNLAKKIRWLYEDNDESWVITDNCALVREGAELYSNLNGSLDDALASIIYDAKIEGATMVSDDVMVHDTSLPLIYLSGKRESLIAYTIEVLGLADRIGVPLMYDQDHVLKYSAEKAQNPVYCEGTDMYAACPFQSVRLLQRILPNVSVVTGDYSLRHDGVLNSKSISVLAVVTQGYLRDVDWNPLTSFLSSKNVQSGNTLYGFYSVEISTGSELTVSSLSDTENTPDEQHDDDGQPSSDPGDVEVYDPEYDEVTINLWKNRSKNFFTILAIVATFIILTKLFKEKENE